MRGRDAMVYKFRFEPHDALLAIPGPGDSGVIFYTFTVEMPAQGQ